MSLLAGKSDCDKIIYMNTIFMTADDIVRKGMQLVNVSASEIYRIVSLDSSGTEGKKKRLFFSADDLERTVSFFEHGMSYICSPGSTTAILMPGGGPNGLNDLLSKGLEKIGVKAVDVSVSADITNSEEVLSFLSDLHPDTIVGMPWDMRYLAMMLPKLCPKSVLISADYVPSGCKDIIKSFWKNTKVFLHYGMTECCYGFAVEHSEGSGMFIRDDEFKAEIIDPETLEPVPFGQKGELVFTTVNRRAMPLINYRTGDIASMSEDGRLIGVYGRIKVPTSYYQNLDEICLMKDTSDFNRKDGIIEPVGKNERVNYVFCRKRG